MLSVNREQLYSLVGIPDQCFFLGFYEHRSILDLNKQFIIPRMPFTMFCPGRIRLLPAN